MGSLGSVPIIITATFLLIVDTINDRKWNRSNRKFNK